MVKSREIYQKGFYLFKSGKVRIDIETEKRIHFTVIGEHDIHYVIYNKSTNQFICDCKWFSLTGKKCSHIVACELFLKERSNIKDNSPNDKPNTDKIE